MSASLNNLKRKIESAIQVQQIHKAVAEKQKDVLSSEYSQGLLDGRILQSEVAITDLQLILEYLEREMEEENKHQF